MITQALSKKKVQRWVLITFSLLIFVFLISLPFWIDSKWSPPSEFSRSIFIEVFKLLFIVVIGGIAMQEYNHNRQKRLERKAYRREVYKMLVNTYMELKRVRWVVRANCKSGMLPYKVYKSSIDKLIDIKSKLEFIDSEISIENKTFKKIQERLRENLGQMENYLRSILKESIDLHSVEKADTIDVSSRPCFINFITPGATVNGYKEDSDFGKNYREHFRSAIKELQGV